MKESTILSILQWKRVKNWDIRNWQRGITKDGQSYEMQILQFEIIYT